MSGTALEPSTTVFIVASTLGIVAAVAILLLNAV
jgi:hypothetical protein